MLYKSAIFILLLGLACVPAFAQSAGASPDTAVLWHGIERALRYTPEGRDFVIVNGNRRFNRALYGTNTGFRVEAGDLPQFALYMPGMGGTLKFALLRSGAGKWLIDADRVVARYCPGAMRYEISDTLLGNGRLFLNVFAMPESEGVLVKAAFEKVPADLELMWGFGGASGKRFNRDGDIGADPESCFYLKPEYCSDNIYTLQDGGFTLQYGSGKVLSEAERYEIQHLPANAQTSKTSAVQKHLTGQFPPGAELRLAHAAQQDDPVRFFASTSSMAPVVVGKIAIPVDSSLFFSILNPVDGVSMTYADLPAAFNQAEEVREKLVQRVQLETPDPFVNPVGGALAAAADAIYEAPSFLHGAVAWRMRLNGWRGAYVADPLGWHDRAKAHFKAYALSQLATPESGPVTPDTALNFARQRERLGTALFSSGYICRNPGGDFRAHHYDMNLVFIDQLLRHFRWTGDLDFVREMWPVLKRHLAWEKRCFDGDGDGLYDAYCSIWASDALEYSGGGVTHASAYNYLANKMAAQLAMLIGESPEPFRNEADKILTNINSKLWMPSPGGYAEFKEILGLQKQHPAAGLWTIYHAIDSEVSDAFQAYQALRYVDTRIPHIPVRAEGIPDGYFTLSTSNWMPYTWSVNNVALAEVLHTALAYWQAGRKEDAFHLWKSALLESMYLGASPGSFQQLSFYDAFRGELYRDFADPVGMAGRTLVEGLFGIRPDALNGVLRIQPGWPEEWPRASLTIADISILFERAGNSDRYTIIPSFTKPLKLQFRVRPGASEIRSIRVNGAAAQWQNVETSVGYPLIEIRAEAAPRYEIELEWGGDAIEIPRLPAVIPVNGTVDLAFHDSNLLEVYDPQQALSIESQNGNNLLAIATDREGYRTVFAKIRQGDLVWWAPFDFEIRPPVKLLPEQHQRPDGLAFRIQNNTDTALTIDILTDPGGLVLKSGVRLAAGSITDVITLRSPEFVCGSNRIYLRWGKGHLHAATVTNWDILGPDRASFEMLSLFRYFNERVANIFKQRYESPRARYPTVQMPLQGVGNWCYPLVEPVIDDTGLRKAAGDTGVMNMPQGIPFATPGPGDQPNVIFTSQWDNFPERADIPLSGKARHLYLLMAGSTNPMQSRFDNGIVEILYTDGSKSELSLVNPDSWWPIEQDYYFDGFAFACDHPVPPRVHLKTGLVTREFDDYVSIKGFSSRVIDGGAATVLDLPLDPEKELKRLTIRALANEVVIGLMGATLVR
ncbi:MAG: DUF4450 domain-containing protein [Saprospiraceae bacterium]|nr:DUF4450 domain-containing protein [Saprospiraceae bacterium]